jgi:stage V sporulation protein AD
MLQGHQTWVFASKPAIIASAAIGGPFEPRGHWLGTLTFSTGISGLGRTVFEKAEKKLQEQACETAIKKAGMKKEISSSYSAET